MLALVFNLSKVKGKRKARTSQQAAGVDCYRFEKNASHKENLLLLEVKGKTQGKDKPAGLEG